jgi:RNA polymerase sigma factor (sigma-70 family)
MNPPTPDAFSDIMSPFAFRDRATGDESGAVPAEPWFEQDFRRVYADGFGPLFRYLDRLAGDPDVASDIAQEAFIRLLARGQMPHAPRAWLVSVAHNLLRDVQRGVGRRMRLLAEAPGRTPVGSAPPDPDVRLEADERIREVRAVLDQLSPRDRQALLLRHSGYSYREIAHVLDTAEGSVGTMLLRAAERFRSAFKEMHGAPD